MIQQEKNFVSYIESRVQENGELYARFHLGTFATGQALSIANALRRTLLAEIPGFVVTRVEIEGINHEFATLPGIQENILNILLNLKRMVLTSQDQNTGISNLSELKASINISGPGIITANDIKFPPSIAPILSSHHIATLTSTGNLKLNLIIEYIDPVNLKEPIKKSPKKLSSELILDALPKPIRQVNFGIHKISTGEGEEYISIEIWSNGSIHPKEALTYALEKLTKMFYNFTLLGKNSSISIL
jgi:DNA-directed RNA polymerase subunit alpha